MSEDKQVTIYSTPGCVHCQHAKEFFKENSIDYTEHDVSSDTEKRQEMVERSGQMGVPVIFIGDPSNPSGQAEMVVGFDQGRIQELLGV